MRSVDRKLTFWMAGYYDDFFSARTLPDDFNNPNTTWTSSKTHHGNPINGWATLNPRYTYAWCERGDGASGRFNNAAITTADQHTHNAGIHEWLTYDQNRRNAGKYEGMAQLQYPDSLTNANRQRFDGGTGILGEAYKTADAKDAFLLFSYAHNTGSRYYAAVGTNDSSYGRATSKTPDYDGGSTSTLDALAGIPTGITTPTTVVRTHLAGVYSGEVLYNNAYTASNPKAMLYPIQSPAGKPFLVSEVYMTSASYAPVLSFDGTLNSKGDGDIFTIRMHACAVDTSTARFKLSIGCEGSAFTSSSSGDTGYSRAAIELEITPSAYQETTSWSTPPTLTSLWDDYDFVIDYTNNRYTLYKNGAAVVTNQAMTTKADGTNFTATDMYGWMIQGKSCSKKAAVLIDRVGLIRPLNDYPSGIEMPPAVSMAYTSAVNSVSTLNLTLIDDDSQLKLLEFFNATSYADWSLLMFRDAVDRPIWRGTVKSLNYNMSAVERTPTIKLTASDNFEPLDQQIPTWELGDSGDADSTSVVAYNRSEAQNNLNTYYFGASRLISANATLGFNEIDDGSGVFLAHKDSRMRNRSAHPIQIYNDDDTIGPNATHVDWDSAIINGHATASAQYRVLQSRWLKDFRDSLWFRHMFGKIQKTPLATTTLASDFTVGSTAMSISDFILGGGGSIEIIDADGTVDGGVVTSASPASSATIKAIDWIAVGNVQPTQPNTALWGVTRGVARPYIWVPIIYVPTTASASDINRNIIVIEGSSNTNLNGAWYAVLSPLTGSSTVSVTRNGTSCWPVILYPAGDWRTWGNTNITSEWHFSSPAITTQTKKGFGVFYTTNPTSVTTNANIGVTGFRLDQVAKGEVWSTETTAGTIKYGTMTAVVPATNFFQRNHSAGATVNVRGHSDDYKHVWVMWADMRNDGSADADQGFRRKNFGLMAPYAQNYSVSMVLANSAVSNDSERQEFVDLAIGADVDLWEMDATQDPITGNTWSSVGSDSYSPASFSGSVDDRYHNWQDKAGAFVFVDTSKFFNLNTESNAGKTGQTSGGRKEVGDYLVETEGFPVLIDNYWVRAATGPSNLEESASTAWNDNYKYLNSEATVLTTDIEVGDELIQLNDDIIKIDNAIIGDVGAIVSHEKDKIWHFCAIGKPAAVSGVNVASAGAGLVELTAGTSSSYLTKFRKGQRIVVSGSNTTPNIDGEYIIQSQATNPTPASYAIEIQLSDTTATVSAGTCTVVGADHTYQISRLLDLGMPKLGTTTAGEWNGAGYGSGNNNAEYLLRVYGPNFSLTGSQVDIPIGEVESGTSYSDAVVNFGLANVFPMRLMMQVDGFIENRGSLTFNDSDKFRVTWLDSLTYNWLAQSALYGIPSLASIPNTGRMTTTQESAINDANGSFIASTTGTGAIRAGKVSVIVNSAGPDPNLQDGDVIEIYGNSQLSKVGDGYRSRYVVSDVGTNGSYNFDITLAGITATTNHEGYWRKVGTFDDFGQVNDCRNSTIANIFATTQAGAGIGTNDGVRSVMSWLMGRDSQPSYRPTYNSGFQFNANNLRVSALSTESTNQISNVRVFYNGSTSFVDYPQATLNTRPRWEIVRVDSVTSKNEALVIAKQEYEKNKAAPFSVSAEILRFSDSHTMNGLNDVMLYNARYGYVADQSRTIPRTSTLAGAYTEDKAWAWASLWGGNLFSGIQNALDGRDGPATLNTDTQSTLDYNNNYYWYGANSVSYAVQVVHIPQGMPKSTEKTAAGGYTNADGNLRIAIDIDDRYGAFLNPENAVFRIYLLDYDWRSLPAGSGIGGPNLIDSTNVSVSQNGLYNLTVPTSYWSSGAGSIVISVNHDYLVSLLRQRCGSSNTHLNAHDWAGVTYSEGHNTDSIFPLGVHKFGQADYWNHNSEWYAPRLHIVDDVNFVAATTVDYTDAQMGLSGEKLSIKSLSWSISSRDTEKLNMTLERDVSRAAKNFASYILPKVSRGGTQSSSQGNQGGGGGGKSSSPPSDGKTTGGRGGDNAGNPKGGAWKGSGAWGDGNSGATSSSELNPITNPNRTGSPDGVNTSEKGVHKLSSSAMGNTTLNRIKGTMNFNNDSVTGGSFSVLGQTKPSAAPRDNSGITGLDSAITPISGDAIMGDDGMMFAGAGDWVSPPTIFKISSRVPANSQSDEVRVIAKATMGAASGNAVLLVGIECAETGVKKTNEITISNIERGSVVLFSGILEGASVSNNTIIVTIERNAGQGSDTASYASVILHSVELSTDNRSVAGSSGSKSYTYSE